jgi:hypothetical protein
MAFRLLLHPESIHGESKPRQAPRVASPSSAGPTMPHAEALRLMSRWPSREAD